MLSLVCFIFIIKKFAISLLLSIFSEMALIVSSIRHNGDEFTEPSRFIEECLSNK